MGVGAWGLVSASGVAPGCQTNGLGAIRVWVVLAVPFFVRSVVSFIRGAWFVRCLHLIIFCRGGVVIFSVVALPSVFFSLLHCGAFCGAGFQFSHVLLALLFLGDLCCCWVSCSRQFKQHGVLPSSFVSRV